MAIPLSLLAVAILVAITMRSPQTRTWPMAAVHAGCASLVVGGTYVGGVGGSGVAVASFAFAVFASFQADRLGIGAYTASERVADALFRDLEQAVKGRPGSLTEALRPFIQDPTLVQLARRAPTDPWTIAARLYMRFLVRVTDARFANQANPPSGAFMNAGHRFWVIASWRRVIGRPRRPSNWAEDALLRCIWEEFEDLIPMSLLEHGGRAKFEDVASANSIIRDAGSCALVHTTAVAVRDVMVNLMEINLRVATGDRSQETVSVQRALTGRMSRAWQDLAREEMVGQSSSAH